MNEVFKSALWVAPEGAKTSADGNITAWFQLEFELPKDAYGMSLRLAITAHTRYKLTVNGVSVAVGPRKANDRQWFFERTEVSSALRPGANVILAKVISFAPIHYPKNIGRSPMSVLTLPLAPMLLVAGGVYAEDKQLLDVATGVADWRAALDESIEWIGHEQTHYLGDLERWHFDGRALEWKTAVPSGYPLTNDYGEMPPMNLNERKIPLMAEEEGGFIRQMPCKNSLPIHIFDAGSLTEIPRNASFSVELDAGELRTAYMMLSGKGGKGAVVRVRYAECYKHKDAMGNRVKGVRDEPCEGGLDGAYDELLPDGGEWRFESFWFRTFRFIRMEIETKGEPLILSAPRYRQTGYPLHASARVTSDAPWVEKLFDISMRTLRLCMHETHEDCPFYEQLQYTSDTKLQLDFTYAVSADVRMAKQAIDDYHCSLMADGMLQSRTPSQFRQAIPQFALYFIHMIDALYWEEADPALIARYRPTMDAVLDYFDRHIGDDGLVTNLGYWDFADWVPSWRAGVPDAVFRGPSAIHNFVYAWTLKIAANLMRATGREQVGSEYDERAESVLRALKEHCFDESSGLYREGPEVFAFSQHAQVFAVLAGALTGGEAEAALVKSIERADIAKCTYPMQFYLLRALTKIGRYDLSEGVWRGFIDLLPLNLTTLPETPLDPRSDCHAWSALMLYDAPRVWLGVRANAPGYREILIKPTFLEMLPGLSGVVPTPRGPVSVRWTRGAEGIEFVADTPKGVPVVVELPGKASVHLPDGGHYLVKS